MCNCIDSRRRGHEIERELGRTWEELEDGNDIHMVQIDEILKAIIKKNIHWLVEVENSKAILTKAQLNPGFQME